MWVEFRRKHLRFIYVPVINFLYVPVINFLKNPLPSSFRTRRYIKKMVKSFIQESNTSKTSRVRIIYDFANSPHTFGDFMIVVMLGRFLALSGRRLVLTAVDSTRRSDWKELDEALQDERIDELLELARYLLPESTKVELTKNYLPLSSDINLDSKSFYAAAPYFLDLLITKYKWPIPDSYLLRADTSDTSEPYIAWHVRKASYDIRRNIISSSIQSDFEILQKRFPGCSVMLISDSAGLESAFHALTGSSKPKTQNVGGTKVLAQPIPGFQNAIPAVLGGSFYFQRGGGGIGVAAIFSSIPYINLCPDKSYFYGQYRGRIMPWSNEQQYFLYVRKNLQSLSIEKLVNRLAI
jgi:hypothetical protein